jgi:hypothetical protein
MPRSDTEIAAIAKDHIAKMGLPDLQFHEVLANRKDEGDWYVVFRRPGFVLVNVDDETGIARLVSSDAPTLP